MRSIKNLIKEGIDPFYIAHFLPHEISIGSRIKGERILAEFKGKKVLDAGSGCGWLSRMAISKKYAVTSIDYSIKVINLEKEFAKLSGLKQLKITKASILKLPYKNQTFDTIVCSEVLEHIEPSNVKIALKEFNRVLRKNGVLIITVPGFLYGLVYDFLLAKTFYRNRSKCSYVSCLNKSIPENNSQELKFEEIDSHKQQFSPRKVTSYLDETGFKLLKKENLEVITPFFRTIANLFKINRKKFDGIERFDAYISKKLPLVFSCDWIFVAGKK